MQKITSVGKKSVKKDFEVVGGQLFAKSYAIAILLEQVLVSSSGQFFDAKYYFLIGLVIKSKKGNDGDER